MARPLRIQYEGAVYHVMCRGNRGAALFALSGERELFFRTLEEVIDSSGWMVHAYALMSTHFHQNERFITIFSAVRENVVCQPTRRFAHVQTHQPSDPFQDLNPHLGMAVEDRVK